MHMPFPPLPDDAEAQPLRLTAERKLYLLDLFSTLFKESDFLYADEVDAELGYRLATAEDAPYKTLMDYTIALRKRGLQESSGPTLSPYYTLSGALFRTMIAAFSQLETLPEDISRQDLPQLFAHFPDQIRGIAPHHYFLHQLYNFIENDPDISFLLQWNKKLRPEAAQPFLQTIHAAFAESLDIMAATVTCKDKDDESVNLGAASTENTRMDGNFAMGDHKIAVRADRDILKMLETVFHETNHIYQGNAFLALATYHKMVEEIMSQGHEEPMAAQILKERSEKSGTDLFMLIKHMIISEEFRYFARLMAFAHSVYPEDTAKDLVGYIKNPLEVQAFDAEAKAKEFIEADAEKRAQLKQEALNRLQFYYYAEQERERIRITLENECSSASSAPVAGQPPVVPS